MGTDSRPHSRSTRFNRSARFALSGAVALTGFLAPVRAATSLGAAEKRDLEREARLVIDLLQNYHYSDRAFRDLDTHEVLTRFIGALDQRGLFLTKEDVDFIQLRFNRSLKPVYLFKGDLSPAFEIHDLFLERARARLTWIDERLGRGFDFTVDESLALAADSGPVPKAELDRRWELYLKSAVLNEILDGRSAADASAEVKRSYARWRQQLASLDPLAVRERFFEVVINTFDPHSGYFSADTAKEFSVDMEGAVAGLGLDLMKDAGRCVVAAVQPGGPADLQGELQPGDEIVAFATGDTEWTETKGRRLREIVALVRGDPDTKLRVAYRRKGDSERRELEFKRARVVLAGERAHGGAFTVPGTAGESSVVGWIELPSFYTAGEDAKLSSAARDVRELIENLQARGATALVLDLRRNPGGALTEAVALSGLFLPSGAVMLTRGLDGKVTVHELKEDKALWHGPLVVLTSDHSASASEIFAGAMRFHRRAVVFGGETTFGKGTVQNYIDLAKMTAPGTNGTAAWGVLRLTAQRFYQPDGHSVQRAGAKSHLVLADYGDPGDEREEALPHALPAESIPTPAGVTAAEGKFRVVDDTLLAALGEQLRRDQETLPEFALRKRIRAVDLKKPEPTVSLQLARRREDLARELEARHALRREQRAFVASDAWACERLEIAEVRAARAAHQIKLKTVRPDGTSPLNRLNSHSFLAGNGADAPWYELEFAHFDFRRFVGDGDELAPAFTTGSGHALEAKSTVTLLERLAQLEEPDTKALIDAIAAVPELAGLDRGAVTRGAEAMFRRMTELEPDLLREQHAFDVPLREALRLAAASASAKP